MQQQFDIICGGPLVGYQLNRQMAAEKSLGRSNGCAYVTPPGHIPMQRMPNVSLQPDPTGPSTEELLPGVDRGIYIVDKSWSIDMQRYNFQFTGSGSTRSPTGSWIGQLRDVAYQATTTDFWRSMEAVGGPQTYLSRAFNCGKGQPGQVAPVSYGTLGAVPVCGQRAQHRCRGSGIRPARRPLRPGSGRAGPGPGHDAGGGQCHVERTEANPATNNALTTNGEMHG